MPCSRDASSSPGRLGALGPAGAVILAASAAGIGGFAAYLRARLGGVTGDCLGASVEAAEAGVLGTLAVLGGAGLA